MKDDNTIITTAPRFIIDHNVGTLVRWLRMMGFDSIFFTGENDSEMVNRAISENRIILTRDTGIAQRRLVKTGLVKLLLLTDENPMRQIETVVQELALKKLMQPFSRCIECNSLLEERNAQEVQNRVPPYVFKTQAYYRECPGCHRIYWRGTHWEAMIKKMALFLPA